MSAFSSNAISLTSAGSTDAFILRFDNDGAVVRAAGFGGPEVELVYSIDATTDGSLWLGGHFQGEADLAPGPSQIDYRASGTADTEGFVLALDPEGNHRKALLLSGNDVAIASGVAALGDNGVATTGIFGKDIRIGKQHTLNSRGKSDVFVTRSQF